MSAGAGKDYTFAQKSHWRRWTWNRIAERTKLRQKAVVVGLFGAEGLDVPCATKHGFRKENCISIERDKGSVAAQRARGMNVAKADLAIALACMLKAPPQVVLADTCSNFASNSVFPLMEILLGLTTNQAITVALNLMRGREPGHMRGVLAEYSTGVARTDSYWGGRAFDHIPGGEINRASMFVRAMSDLVGIRLCESGVDPDEAQSVAMEQWGPRLRSEYSSYKSGGLVFDSVVLRLPAMNDILPNGLRIAGVDIVGGSLVGKTFGRRRISTAAVRSVAAARAIRTMRARGAAA